MQVQSSKEHRVVEAVPPTSVSLPHTICESENLARATPCRVVTGAGKWHSSKEYLAYRPHPWLPSSHPRSPRFLHLSTFHLPPQTESAMTDHTGSPSTPMHWAQPSMRGAEANS